ncbi:Rieske (2Fe-2S) protein [Luteolibacter soli]|uniref:Rieske (2Fe-2S) protein n=1 Tax=Luteolibacter soli TaxID=3135280 RepID=A0ABU9B041_9BACT
MNSLPDSSFTRRTWVKRFVLGSATALLGPQWAGTVLAEQSSGPAVLRLKISDYPPLAEPLGSIQLVFIDYLKPFTLNRVDATTFVTLDSKCTHQGCTVGRYAVVDGVARMRCPCHGSRYDIEGKVFRDSNGQSTEPAQNDIARFPTTFDATSGIVSISIPDLALSVRSISMQTRDQNGNLRLKLQFPVTGYAKYEIRHAEKPDGPFTVIPFSLTPAGPANATELFPELDGTVSAYVDATGPKGFYAVALKLIPF